MHGLPIVRKTDLGIDKWFAHYGLPIEKKKLLEYINRGIV